jgi:hypothetical protein
MSMQIMIMRVNTHSRTLWVGLMDRHMRKHIYTDIPSGTSNAPPTRHALSQPPSPPPSSTIDTSISNHRHHHQPISQPSQPSQLLLTHSSLARVDACVDARPACTQEPRCGRARRDDRRSLPRPRTARAHAAAHVADLPAHPACVSKPPCAQMHPQSCSRADGCRQPAAAHSPHALGAGDVHDAPNTDAFLADSWGHASTHASTRARLL